MKKLIIIPFLIICSNSKEADILNHISEINSPQALLTTSKFQESNYYNSKEEIEFAKAVSKFDRDKMDLLLKNGLNINSLGTDSISFLCWAFIKYKKNSYKYLLENSADSNIKLKNGNTIITFARKQDDRFYLDLALEYSGELD